ncbi:hypothetical protein FRC14_000826 [Serendipita sp. 396]|nr:hypothetical protein FRC14_000826 [Serendipita sp. 396]KAG8857706.1 hypothetical protein FRC20_000230 [Serendipita sp. 405]
MEGRKIYRKNGSGGGSKGGGGARGKASGSDPGSGHSGSSGNSGSSDRGQSEGISMEIEAGSRNEDRVGAVAGGRDRRSGATAGAMKTVRSDYRESGDAAGWSGGMLISKAPDAAKGHGRRFHSRVPDWRRRQHHGRYQVWNRNDGGRRESEERVGGRGRREMEGIRNEEGGMENGQVLFRSLVAQGALVRNVGGGGGGGGGGYEGGKGYERRWDECSSTPWLRGHGQVVSYDDPESMRLKGQFIKEQQMRGVGMWCANGDDEGWPLVDSVIRGMGGRGGI